nr:hypothetical protein [Trentepohlia sp. YN1242]
MMSSKNKIRNFNGRITTTPFLQESIKNRFLKRVLKENHDQSFCFPKNRTVPLSLNSMEMNKIHDIKTSQINFVKKKNFLFYYFYYFQYEQFFSFNHSDIEYRSVNLTSDFANKPVMRNQFNKLSCSSSLFLKNFYFRNKLNLFFTYYSFSKKLTAIFKNSNKSKEKSLKKKKAIKHFDSKIFVFFPYYFQDFNKSSYQKEQYETKFKRLKKKNQWFLPSKNKNFRFSFKNYPSTILSGVSKKTYLVIPIFSSFQKKTFIRQKKELKVIPDYSSLSNHLKKKLFCTKKTVSSLLFTKKKVYLSQNTDSSKNFTKVIPLSAPFYKNTSTNLINESEQQDLKKSHSIIPPTYRFFLSSSFFSSPKKPWLFFPVIDGYNSIKLFLKNRSQQFLPKIDAITNSYRNFYRYDKFSIPDFIPLKHNFFHSMTSIKHLSIIYHVFLSSLYNRSSNFLRSNLKIKLPIQSKSKLQYEFLIIIKFSGLLKSLIKKIFFEAIPIQPKNLPKTEQKTAISQTNILFSLPKSVLSLVPKINYSEVELNINLSSEKNQYSEDLLKSPVNRLTSARMNNISSIYPKNAKNSKIEKLNDKQFLQNYYACISQITSWGSDPNSWVLFLKYMRTNIYKGDLLLSYEKKRTNFQLLPKTGSILLEQLLLTISDNFILTAPSLQKIQSSVAHSSFNKVFSENSFEFEQTNKTYFSYKIRKNP